MKKEKYLFVDIETGSKTDIGEGVDRYFADPSAHIIVLCAKELNDDKLRVVENFDRTRAIKLPKWLTEWKGVYVAHNWAFEFSAFKHMAPGTRLADPKNWLCTQALAHRFNLPGNLEGAAKSLRLDTQKSPDGKRLIQEYSLPDKKTGNFRPIPEADRKAWAAYCSDDVHASEGVFKILFPLWGETERQIFETDKIINERGVCIDVKGAQAIQAAWGKFIERTENAARALAGVTKGDALTISSPSEFRAFCASLGVELADARAETVEAARQVIEAKKTKTQAEKKFLQAVAYREILAARAVGKTEALLKGVSPDGRYRHSQKYHVAHTGRWQSWGVNFYNFPRESVKPEEWAQRLSHVQEDGSLTDFVSLQRGLITAPRGKTLIVSDYAGIENRILLWLAKDTTQLKRIAAGESPYLIFAEKLYPGERVTKADTAKYTKAKAAVLGLGYHQGPKKFAEINKYLYAEAELIVKIWRAAHPAIVKMWKDFDAAFRSAIGGGDVTVWGQRFYKRPGTSTVCVELLSGRTLFYRHAGIRPHGRIEGKLEISAIFGKSEVPAGIHGGTLTENVVQGLARDLLAPALVEIEKELGGVVLHVYDEIVVETEKKNAKAAAARIAEIMTAGQPWSKGLPLAVEQKICERWGK